MSYIHVHISTHDNTPSHLPTWFLWEAKQIMDRKVLFKLGSLRELSHPVIVQQGTPHFPPVTILTYLVVHMSAYVHKGSPDSPKDIFSSTLSYECTTTVCMGLVCGCSYTWLLGTCSCGWWFHTPSARLYLCTYIHSCKHTYSCVLLQPWGSFWPQANSQLPSLCPESAWQDMGWMWW